MLARICLTLLALSLPATPLAAQASRHSLTGSDIAIYNLVGTLRAEAGTGTSVEVEVTRRGDDAARLRVETGPLGGRQTLRVIFPDDVISYRGLGRWFGTSSLSARDDGTFGDGRGGRRVRITGRGDGLNAAADVVVRIPAGKHVALYIGVGQAEVRNVQGELVVDGAAADITVTGTRGSLTLDTGSGELRVTDVSGTFDFDTGSGDVRLSRVRGDRLLIDAGSGSFEGDDIEVRSLQADLGSGSTRLTRVRTPELRLDSGSGSVDVELSAAVDVVSVEAGSGSVTLRLPETLSAMLDIETGSGGIDTDFPITLTSRSRSHLRGRIGDGKGRISIETGSGGVRLRRL